MYRGTFVQGDLTVGAACGIKSHVLIPVGCQADIRSGLGRSLWSTLNFSAGPLGEGPGRFREGVVFRVVSLGNNVFESPCAVGGSVIGRVSVADASLSLSLSLSGRATHQLKPGRSSRLAGLIGRLGFSHLNGPVPDGVYKRVVGALSASCPSTAVGWVPVAVLCCPGSSVVGDRRVCLFPGLCEEGSLCR